MPPYSIVPKGLNISEFAAVEHRFPVSPCNVNTLCTPNTGNVNNASLSCNCLVGSCEIASKL